MGKKSLLLLSFLLLFYSCTELAELRRSKSAINVLLNDSSDSNAPIPGNSGLITAVSFTSNSVTLSWVRATDNTSDQANLRYSVYYSSVNNISSVSNIETNGNLFGVQLTNTNSQEVTGLNPNSGYYFNIIVQDEAGNKACYTANSATTLDGPPKYRRLLTINSGKVSGTSNLLTFPVMINITAAYLKSTNNGGKVESTGGYDIYFTAQDGTTLLSYEIESYDPVNGSLIAWVSIPTLSYTANTLIYMYYGRNVAGSQENAAAIWDSSTKGVWHLNDYHDSTSNSFNGVNNGTGSYSGPNGGVCSFNGSSFIDMGNVLDLNTNALTISMWIQRGTTNMTTLVAKSIGGNPAVSYGYLLAIDSSLYPHFYMASQSGAWGVSGSFHFRANTGISNFNWHHVVFVVDRTTTNNCKIYINGVDNTGPLNGDITAVGDVNNTNNLMIGSESDGGNKFNGNIDEVTISQTARSAGWVITTYNNQLDPSTFYTVGNEESSW